MRKIESYKSNLLERVKIFAVNIIKTSSLLPKNPAGFTLADQLVRAGTAIGSNLIEAQEAVSKKDFIYKINHGLKEAKETQYWLDLIMTSKLIDKIVIIPLLRESEEIVKILVATVKKLRINQLSN